MRRVWLAIVMLVPAPVCADIPPGPPVETCTVEHQEASGGQGCILCTASTTDYDACQRQHGGTRVMRCRGMGSGSTWPEVWCDDGLLAGPRRVLDPSSDFERGERIGRVIGTVIGCGCCVFVPLLAGGGAYLVMRRRKRAAV
jgi:hypothetical protein